MKRYLAVLIWALLWVGPAQAQWAFPGVNPNYSGTSITLGPNSGYNTTAGVLFVPSSASLNFTGAFTVAYWMLAKGTLATQNTQLLLDARQPAVSGTGFYLGNYYNGNNDIRWHFAIGAGSTGFFCSTGGVSCTRAAGVFSDPFEYLNDSQWHHVCQSWNGSNTAATVVDGQLQDRNVASSTYTVNSTGYWELGQGISVQVAEMRIYTRALASSECATLYAMGRQGLAPSSGALSTGMAAYWPMNNCNVTGCVDVSGGNNFVYDTSTPTVAITAPSTSGPFTGNVTLQATCTDSFQCASVQWFVDSAWVATSTTSPYTETWASANFIDGTHIITAVGTNVGGHTNTANLTVTSSNSVTAKTVFLDPVSGLDSNNCLTTGTPCQTFNKANTFTYHGGDSILLKAGTTMSIASATLANELTLLGASSGAGTQNVFSGPTITVGTYNGGTCIPLAGTTSGCATVLLSANSMTTATGIINSINVSNITIQNLIIDGGNNQSQPMAGASGILMAGVGGQVVQNFTTQNVKVKDFGIPIYVANNISFGAGGTALGWGVSQSWVTAAAVTDNGGTGIDVVGAKSGTVTSNIVENQGGTTNVGSGTGILLVNSANSNTNEFNVTRNNSANTVGLLNPFCNGNSYSSWTYDSALNNFIGNEAYAQGPTPQGLPWTPFGCDTGGFDFDGGTASTLIEYNYAHENDGSGYINLAFQASGQTWGNNTIRYNLDENNLIYITDGSGSSIEYALGTTVVNPIYVYNNTSWNGNSGQTFSGVGAVTKTGGWAIGAGACPQVGSVVANNIFASTAYNGTTAIMAYQDGLACTPALTYITNDWVGISGSALTWNAINSPTNNASTLAAWQAATGSDVGALTVSPQFSGTPPANNCYASGTPGSVPVQPGTIPCPTIYKVITASPLIGTGTDLTRSPYNLTVGSTDFFNVTIPNSIGYNIGADGHASGGSTPNSLVIGIP